MSSSDIARESSAGMVLITFVTPASITNPPTRTLLTNALLETLKNDSACLEAQKAAGGSPAVRFSSVNEEIDPQQSLTDLDSTSNLPKISGESEANLRALSSSLRAKHLQSRRMSAFNFEPVSLPASRVRSNSHISSSPSSHSSDSLFGPG
jgi:hypothetical protein